MFMKSSKNVRVSCLLSAKKAVLVAQFAIFRVKTLINLFLLVFISSFMVEYLD